MGKKLEIPSRIMTLGDWRRWWLSVEDKDVEGAWDVKLVAVDGLVAELQKQRDDFAKVEGTGTFSPIMPLSDVIKLLDHFIKELGAKT